MRVASTRPSFELLGPLRITSGSAEVLLGTPKQRAVLAMLLLNRNRSVGVESLISAAWGEAAPEGARATVHVYVSNLRRLLSTAGVDGRTALAKAPPGYRLNVADADVDLGRFVGNKTAGVRAAAAGRFDEASHHLSAALAEWRGPVLEDLHNDFGFVEPFAVSLHEDKIAAHTALAEAEIVCGRPDAVIAGLEELIADQPYREPLWAQLITAYYADGRQADALNAYTRLKSVLADELGIDPAPTLQALYQKVLRQEPLQVQASAQSTALQTLVSIEQRSAIGVSPSFARLRDSDGNYYPLHPVATRIGRHADNDIVLPSTKVSRHHAIIIDTGTTFVINDLRSVNGIILQNKRIRASAQLSHGHRLRIGDRHFTFEIVSEQPGAVDASEGN